MTAGADWVVDPSHLLEGASTGGTSRRRTDLLVLGALPLEITRVHRQGATGGVFGPGWCSLLDVHLEVDGDGVRLVRADGSVLVYADPVVGRPELPRDGDPWPLVLAGTGAYVVTDPATGRRHHFDRAHTRAVPLHAVSDERGHRFSLVRDLGGQLLELRHTGGVRVLVATADDRVTGLRLAPTESGHPDERWPRAPGDEPDQAEVGEEVVRYAYDDRGRLVGLGTPSGPAVQTWTWDDADRLVSWTDRTGHEVRLDDGEPPVTGTPARAWADTSSWQLSPDGREAVRTDATGARTRVTLDRAGRPVRLVGLDGATWSWTYDLGGRLTSATDPERGTTRLTRSAEGLLEAVVLPSGATARWVRDAEGRPVELVDPDGEVTRVECDSPAPIAAGTGPATVEEPVADVAVERDACGRVLARTHPDGLVEEWQLDAAGRPAGLTLTLDRETRRLTLARDACGREVSRVLPGGPVLEQTWDTDGWLVAQTLSRPDADAARSRLESRLAGLGASGPAAPAAPPEVLLQRRLVRSPAGRVTRVEGPDAELRPAPPPQGHLTWVQHEGRPLVAVTDGLRVLSALDGPDGRPEALLDPDGRVLALPPGVPGDPATHAGGLDRQVGARLGLDVLTAGTPPEVGTHR